jgi:hypothetical protein
MVATQDNSGQDTPRIAAEKAQAMSVIIIQNRKTGEVLKYAISTTGCPSSWAGTRLTVRKDSMPRWPRTDFSSQSRLHSTEKASLL